MAQSFSPPVSAEANLSRLVRVRPERQRLRLLVVIASYGDRNLKFLQRIITRYQQMPMHVDLIVLSEAPKQLGDGVKVVAGLPSRDPWSLPFGHKEIFAREVENYDLFIYSEDDIQYSERNIEAFLKASDELAADEIAGFLLYEEDQAGTKWLPSIYAHWHWKPDSIRRRGRYTVGEFSNLHSASYLISQTQLRRAIASGGFLRAPYEHKGLYDLLCTAATDPYTSCGFRKVICISDIEDFLVHHTPNKYTNISCMTLPMLRDQVATMQKIGTGLVPARSLLPIEPKFRHFGWQKSYYETPGPDLLGAVPQTVGSLLSVGCGWGATEAELVRRGVEVHALPLDSVIGEVAARRGIRIIHGTWDEGREKIKGRRFECVMMTNLLHLHPQPTRLLGELVELVAPGGWLVLGGPNFNRMTWYLQRKLRMKDFSGLGDFEKSAISLCGASGVLKQLRQTGFDITALKWLNHDFKQGFLKRWAGERGVVTAKDWLLQARRWKAGEC